jgi:hypothetical protein
MPWRKTIVVRLEMQQAVALFDLILHAARLALGAPTL